MTLARTRAYLCLLLDYSGLTTSRWEPDGNINSSGGDDDVLAIFWSKADLDGRDRGDVKSWKRKETVWLTDEIASEDPEYPKSRRPARTWAINQYRAF